MVRLIGGWDRFSIVTIGQTSRSRHTCKATQLDANSVRACQSLGYFYGKRSRNSEAAQQFEKCVQLAPDEADEHYALGTAYSDLGRYPDARNGSCEALLRLKRHRTR